MNNDSAPALLELRTCARRLQAAVAAERLADALELVEEYRQFLDTALQDPLHEGRWDREQLLTESRELLQSVLRVTAATRAHCAQRLTSISASRKYSETGPRLVSSWHIDG